MKLKEEFRLSGGTSMPNWIYFLFGFITGIMILLASLKYIKAKRKKSIVEDIDSIFKLLEKAQDMIYYSEIKPYYKHLYVTPSIDYFLGEGTIETLYANSNLPFEIIHPDDLDILNKKIMGELDYSKSIIQRFRDENGVYRWFEEFTTPIYENGELVAVQGVMRNIDEKVKLEQELKYQVIHDALTDLYNRGYFEEMMNKYNKDVNTPISIMLCDLDELKYINDSFGHTKGDKLICDAAKFLLEYFPQATVIARIGGDEFAIIQTDISDAQIGETYKEIQVALERYNTSCELQISMSVGYAFSEQSINKMDQLFIEADQKMYEQKKAKKQSAVRS